ncbi:MAG TPA: DNA adenine methylase [Humisphaera sp.]|jgi:DNA adenine methylase|nr:DNA adenine methylase [Humisphaera sp.]
MPVKGIRPPVKWHGGKHYLWNWIVAQFPRHSTYVEPFGGAASVLLNKQPAPVEVYNDLDQRITRLFRVLRDNGDELLRRLSLTPYSEVEFNSVIDPSDEDQTAVDDVELARRDFVRWRQSIGGRGVGFSQTLHRVRRGMADVVSGYLSAIDENLPKIIQRLRTVQIISRPAIDVIQKWDGPDTLIYCDPPYVHDTRAAGSHEVYGVELTAEDHRQLAQVLNASKSKVILSGYPSPLYKELYKSWRKETKQIPNHAAGGTSKAMMDEVLWMNW